MSIASRPGNPPSTALQRTRSRSETAGRERAPTANTDRDRAGTEYDDRNHGPRRERDRVSASRTAVREPGSVPSTDRRVPGSAWKSDRETDSAPDPPRDVTSVRAAVREVGSAQAADRGADPTMNAGRHRRRPVDDDRERGSATVLSVGVLAATVILAAGFAAAGQAGAARHQAQGAADAAALAAAAKVLLGPGEACSAAAELVAENRTEMESCEVSELEVTVRVTTEPAGMGDLFGPARASSRAGPVTAL